MNSKIETVFFDLDRTLFDQIGAHKAALRRLREEYNSLFSDSSFEEMVDAFYKAEEVALRDFRNGRPLEELRLARSVDFLDILDIDTDYAGEINERFYELYPSIDAPIDGAEELLQELYGDYELGVISNGTERDQRSKLEALGFVEYFDSIKFSEEVGCRKPDSKIFHEAMGDLGREAKECMMVGDSYATDMVGAKKVGMVACWFNPWDGDPSDEDIELDFEIVKLKEISDLVG